jgi:two-component system CheB/CheR fusion protein
VKSITRRTAESSGSVEEMEAQLSGRLDAFGRVQAAVTRNPDQGVSLRSLVADELLAHGLKDGDTVEIDGPDIRLKPRAAESMSLAVHELATNAIKHGPVGNDSGRIAIKWELNGHGGEKQLDFQWVEPANGLKVEPKRKGFGVELLTQGLPYDLNGKTNLELGPDGVQFNLQVPLESVIEGER